MSFSKEEAETLLAELRRLTIANAALAAAIQEKDAVIQDIENNSIFQYFKHGGRRLPRLSQDGSTSGPTPNTKHEKIKSFEEKVFGMLDMKDNDLEDMKRVQASIPFSTSRGYSTEMDVQQLCKQFLDDMIKASKLSHILELRCDLQIADLKADFWVISYNGFPVGAIEVKKPGKGDRERDYGQLFDYMLRIRSFHGIRSVFGICTNFVEWTICWLPDSDVVALATNLVDSTDEISNTSATNRILHVSETYPYDSTTLAVALTSVLKKMNKSAEIVDPVPLVSPTRAYIVLTEKKSWIWRNGLKVELNLMPPTRTTKSFYLLRDFHGGADGRVWLACSSAGNIAVIKFQRRLHETQTGDEKSNVDKEVQMWHACGISSVFAGQFSGRHAVVMPFGFHFTNDRTLDENWWRSGHSGSGIPIKHFDLVREKCNAVKAEDVLKGCIERCAQAGIAHEDIEWRHTAIFPKITKPNIFLFRGFRVELDYAFIDLGRMKSFTEPKKKRKELALKTMAAAQARLLADVTSSNSDRAV